MVNRERTTATLSVVGCLEEAFVYRSCPLAGRFGRRRRVRQDELFQRVGPTHASSALHRPVGRSDGGFSEMPVRDTGPEGPDWRATLQCAHRQLRSALEAPIARRVSLGPLGVGVRSLWVVREHATGARLGLAFS